MWPGCARQNHLLHTMCYEVKNRALIVVDFDFNFNFEVYLKIEVEARK